MVIFGRLSKFWCLMSCLFSELWLYLVSLISSHAIPMIYCCNVGILRWERESNYYWSRISSLGRMSRTYFRYSLLSYFCSQFTHYFTYSKIYCMDLIWLICKLEGVFLHVKTCTNLDGTWQEHWDLSAFEVLDTEEKNS